MIGVSCRGGNACVAARYADDHVADLQYGSGDAGVAPTQA